eukprot:TRINITY_DN908_c0_g1_i6.p1 TRINITY_DN908_c0_g1~~TRINITY_DN908_c0_g1_i6.p1  ORF type:complete len:231 (-),score=79.24 TRINITY_DN908_c0_g1_i6:131-823(-)
MELDPSLSKEEKQKHMDEWWSIVQSLIVRLGPTKTMIRRAVAMSRLYFRHKCPELLKTLGEAGLKLHVVSAGITGVVAESFDILQTQRGLNLDSTLVYVMTPEIHDAARDNAVIGFGKPTVTSANKHLCVDHKRYPEIHENTNAILMGDLIEDYLIVKNLKLKEVIGIGFLNVPGEYKAEALDKFTSALDIVIGHDGNLACALEVVKSIIGLPLDEEWLKEAKLTEVLKY